MKQSNYKNIVIKIGTNVLTAADGTLDESVMQQIVDQVAQLKKQGVNVVVVSSGAMRAGRALLQPSEEETVVKRQVLAAVGQVSLMEHYRRLFEVHNLLCAQVLTTKEDFRTRQYYLNMRTCFEALFQENVVPIVNENDVISTKELMFTDNDELAGLVAGMMSCDAVFILTSVDGILDSDGKVIAEIDADFDEGVISTAKSEFGLGGMHTKFHTAKKLASTGVDTYIANGKTKDVVLSIIQGEQVGTKIPAQEKADPLKRWVAHSEGAEKGTLIVNDGAKEMLLSNKAVSLLPVGVISIEGEFEKGDIVKIADETGKQIGLGMVQCGSDEAADVLGKKDQKPLVQYEYLYVL